MKRLAWLTDIHLDFLQLESIQEFCYAALEADPDVFLIGGDISIAPMLHTHLRIIEHYWKRPVYFVLGNHDYYRGSIDGLRRELPAFLQEHDNLKWLPLEGVVELSPDVALIGHGLWADGRLGAGSASQILLNDYALIEELTGLGQKELFKRLYALGDRAVAEFEPLLRRALAEYKHVYALVHVPPFQESAWYNHHISDEQYLPHFACHAVGEMIRDVMRDYSEKRLTILCGHTHGAGESRIADNIFVKTGGARYGHPKVQEILVVDERQDP